MDYFVRLPKSLISVPYAVNFIKISELLLKILRGMKATINKCLGLGIYKNIVKTHLQRLHEYSLESLQVKPHNKST